MLSAPFKPHSACSGVPWGLEWYSGSRCASSHPTNKFELCSNPKLCHPERSRGTCCAPSVHATASARQPEFLPHRQQMLGAPFKPHFGLSGIMALDVPLPVRHARPRETPWRIVPRGDAQTIRLHLRALVFHPTVAEVYRPFGLYALEGFIGPERAAPATSLSRVTS